MNGQVLHLFLCLSLARVSSWWEWGLFSGLLGPSLLSCSSVYAVFE